MADDVDPDVNGVPDEKAKKKTKNGKTCCAPNCKSGTSECTEKVAFHRFPEHMRDTWLAKIPRKNWKIPKEPRLCEKHFSAECFKVEKADTKNPWRVLKKGSELKKKCLKPDAIPTIWPDCPDHLTKSNPTPRRSKNSTGARTSMAKELTFNIISSESPEHAQLTSIEDFDKNLDTGKIPSSISFLCKGTRRIFLDMSYEQDRPVTNFSIVVDENLHTSIVVGGVLVRQNELVSILLPSNAVIKTGDQLYKILFH